MEKKTESIEDLPAEATDLSELIGKIGENMQTGRLACLTLSGDGVIGSYVHSNNKLGVIVELSGAATPELAKDIAMQVAATNPACVTPEQLPAETLAQEKEIYLNQAKEEGKPAQIAEKIVEGRIRKFYQEVCLREQAFIKDDKKTIKDLLGKNADIVRFYRFAIGA
jgi:elongation factor Ts